jgi:hypothetical protein
VSRSCRAPAKKRALLILEGLIHSLEPTVGLGRIGNPKAACQSKIEMSAPQQSRNVRSLIKGSSA